MDCDWWVFLRIRVGLKQKGILICRGHEHLLLWTERWCCWSKPPGAAEILTFSITNPATCFFILWENPSHWFYLLRDLKKQLLATSRALLEFRGIFSIASIYPGHLLKINKVNVTIPAVHEGLGFNSYCVFHPTWQWAPQFASATAIGSWLWSISLSSLFSIKVQDKNQV